MTDFRMLIFLYFFSYWFGPFPRGPLLAHFLSVSPCPIDWLPSVVLIQLFINFHLWPLGITCGYIGSHMAPV